MLSKNEATDLLKIARNAIVHQIKNEVYLPDAKKETALNSHSGCFVTITQNGRLRGCIGNFQSQQPLYKEVAAMAVEAASHDPRFPPMSLKDLDNFKLEITILSPLEKIDDTDQIQVGTHGIYMIKGYNRGVLLPQVATEYGWDKEQFLQQTCIKAGLSEKSWQHPETEIFIFSGEIIHE
ncbi:AmmeMemoRadiSam system protein A [uncultured Desulfuromusa sp.]|uniref:AmmeMemoRadiSam system protein A n=1 Tax=uncultured Desulfuromusa sp. TaxID=219183 RepID=UPI002AA90C38|nr:AmmeMemoRadiSam system protein A [uncultured Desulfuromusa sp.]